MSLKIFNKETGQWEVKASTVANGIKIVDLEGNFESEDVNGALNEISTSLKTLKNDVKYIYENGTIGGGSGGGGASVPVVTIDGNSEYIVNSDEIITIYYYFTSPNPGNGVANLSWGGKVQQISVPQARNKWTVGPFPRGTHNLTISVMDKQGFWSIPATIKVVSGSLAIESSFDDSKDFTLNENIIIPFQVLTEISEATFLDYTFNGVDFTVPVNIGANELNLGILPFMGISTFSMKARNSRYESNVLEYIIVASDSTNLFMSTKFNKSTVEIGKNLQLDFRISMRGQYSFYSDYYINGQKLTTVTTYPGVNFWNVGTNLEKGIYELKIVTRTMDGIHTAELVFNFEVVSVGYEPYRHVRNGLIAEFDATGKINNSTNQTKWEDTSGNNVQCNLYNFNYFSNGWMDNNLVCSGKSYAEINLAPFAQGVKSGLTIEILCKIENVGNVNAKVLSCKAPITPSQGIEINTWNASIVTKRTEITSAQIQDNTWTKVTYVIDRSKRTMLIYLNGIIAGATFLQTNDLSQENYQDEFTYDGKIIIGGGLDLDNKVANNSVSQVKSIRVYRQALTDAEVLQNYIADITDEEEQLKVRSLNTETEGMPTISFVGNFDSMDENSERIGQISYNDPKRPTKTFVKDGCLISWQGTSSKNYPVKNWTIKLRDGGQPTLNFAPDDNWKPESRWTLKANYMDSSNANNLGTNKFIHDFFKPYPYPSQIADPKTRSNVDGFPVRLVINGEEAGICTWNIDRYANNNYGFITYNSNGTINRHPTAVSYEIGVNGTTGAAAFRDDSWNSIRTEFDARYNYRGEEEDITETMLVNGVNTKVLKTGSHNELQTLISWVVNSTDESFRSELPEHFSKRHLIDYYLIAYVFGMVDNLGKNMVLSTWGKNDQGNTIWYPSFYDCDSLYGLNNSGIIAFDAGLDMDKGDYNTSNSLLWVKLNKMFGQEIRERYAELRLARTVDGVSLPPIFSYENIMSYLGDEVMNNIGQQYYNTDARIKYLNTAGMQWLYLCNGSRREFTERWLQERFIYMDSVYQFNYDVKSVLRSYARGQLTLRVKTYSPQWILISFSDAADTKMKLYVGKNNFTEFTMYVDNGTDNNIEIYGTDNIMYLDGIKNLDVRSINIANATKLVELDISHSSRIEEISLGNNKYLQRVLCNDCSKLGFQVDNKTLDLSNCATLRELDCSNTHIANVTFNQTGGVIENLNCSYTDITAFNLNGQEYLQELSLDGCYNLSELTVTNCNGISAITMADTKLSSVIINGCDKLDFLDISNTKSLRILNLSGCPNLKTLLMAGVSNPGIKDLDLTYSLKLETLDISSSNYIETITFGQYTENGVLKNYNALKNLMAQNSTIKSLRYGKATPAPEYLDLGGLSLDYVNFESATNLREIRNINLVARDAAPFNNCYNLRSIQGKVKIIGSAYNAFNNCRLLSTLPTLDLSEMTSASSTFQNCTSFSMEHLKQIMLNSGISNRLTNTYHTFHSCSGIYGQLPANIFSRCTGITNLSTFFYGCINITGKMPADILKPMSNLRTIYYAFENTGISGEIPLDILRYNTRITSTEGMFYNTKITFVNLENLFMYNPLLESVSSMFGKCSSLQVTLTPNIFLYNGQLTDASEFLMDCPGVVGTIPRHIFNNIPKVNGTNKLRWVNCFFEGTSINGTIPKYNSESDKGLLDCSPLLDNVSDLFRNCSGLSGKIPTDLLKYNNNIVSAAGLFDGCSGLGDSIVDNDIPANLLKGKTRITDISRMFKGCSGLFGTIPIGFLDDCIQITDISELFSGCSNLHGEIPKRISTWKKQPSPIDPSIIIDVETVQQYGLFDKCSNLIDASSLFSNCTNLRSEIPSTLFINAANVTDLSYIFHKCHSLYGPIPKELFANCRSVQTLQGAFQDCVGLYNYVVDEDNPYALPPELFQNCFNLTNISSAFSMWGAQLPHTSKLNGTLPPNLFASCTKLTTIFNMFSGCHMIYGNLDSNLFRMNTRLTTAEYAFDSTGIESLGSQLFFTCTSLKNISYAFASCFALTGPAPEYWLESSPIKATSFTACYRGSTGLSNYATILDGWK